MLKEQDFGRPVANWTPPKPPAFETLSGTFAYLERLDAERHAELLYAAYGGSDAVWNYLPYGPFDHLDAYTAWVRNAASQDDPRFYAIFNIDSGAFEGVASYLRISPMAGSIEVGHINFSPALQGTRAATDAMALMMGWAFEAGYRRYEWKCDAANKRSRRAAQRLGLSYEGVFRQAAVIKGRNRDTAWFAAIDAEWPALRTAFDTYLAPDNFEPGGRQRQSLSQLTAGVRVAEDPSLT